MAAFANSVASASVSHSVSMTTRPRAVGSLHHGQAIATPAGRRGRGVGRGRRRSRAARSPAGTRRRCPGAGPTSRPRGVSRGRPGASPRSAPRRRCTCRRGGSARSTPASSSYSASTAGQPPAVWTGVTKPKPVVYGKVSVSRRIAGVASMTLWTAGSLPAATTSRRSDWVRLRRRPLGHQQGRVALVDGRRGRATGRSGRGPRPGP